MPAMRLGRLILRADVQMCFIFPRLKAHRCFAAFSVALHQSVSILGDNAIG
jgi:hypothetical protein